MSSAIYERIRSNPKFHELEKRRGRFAWLLSSIVLVVFYGYILMVAFAPATLARPVSEGATITVGIAFELSMFVGFWILVALYVRRANSEYDQLTQEIVKDAVRDEGAAEAAKKIVAGLLLLVLEERLERGDADLPVVGPFIAAVGDQVLVGRDYPGCVPAPERQPQRHVVGRQQRVAIQPAGGHAGPPFPLRADAEVGPLGLGERARVLFGLGHVGELDRVGLAVASLAFTAQALAGAAQAHRLDGP